ncbi:MAG: carbon-nitrogen hydrolase [Rhodothermales bacterium]
MTNDKVKVGIVQMRCSADPDDNTARALRMTGEAADLGAQIVCLPELFRSRYFCQNEDSAHFALAEPIPGPSSDAFGALAREKGIVVVASLFEKRAVGLYHNTAVVVDSDQGMLGRYRKMHIPDDPRYYEKYYFTPGDLGFKTFQTSRGPIGVLVCWDQWYPEAARLTALQGAEILFYPTAIGWHPEEQDSHGERQHDAWQTAQRAHAIANGCFVVSVNRIGFEPEPHAPEGHGIQFWGQSFIAAPDGSLLAKASKDQEEIIVVELDKGAIFDQRTGWPFLRDRRIDAYDKLTRRYIEAE